MYNECQRYATLYSMVEFYNNLLNVYSITCLFYLLCHLDVFSVFKVFLHFVML